MGHRAAVVLSVVLLATPAHAVVNRIWGNNEQDVSRLTAKTDDELDAQDAAESTPWPVTGLAPTCNDEGEAYYNSTANSLQVCDGSSWTALSSSVGDVTDVGDCSSGACFTAAGDGTVLVFEGGVADSIETLLTVVEPTGSDKTILLPNETGTVCTTGSVCSGYEPAGVTFDEVGTGTNTSGTMTCSTGCTITPGGSGTIVANDTACSTRQLLDGAAVCFSTSGSTGTTVATTSGTHTTDRCIEYDANGNLALHSEGCLTDANYFLLAGRSGGQSAYGGTASGNDLTLTPNSAATDGALNLDGFIDVFTSAPDIATTGSLSWVNVEPDVDLETAGILRFAGYRFAPTIHLGQAAAVVPVVIGFRGQGTITIDDATATPTAPNYQFFDSEWTNTSSVAGVPPVPGEVFVDATTYEYTAATTTATMSSNAPGSFDAKQVYKSTGTGTFSITGTDLASFISEPTVTATNASGNVNITQFNHLYIAGLTQTGGGGTETVTTEIGVHVDTLNADTTNIGIKNDYPTQNTPTAQTLTADTNQINHTASTMALSANGNYTMSSNPVLSDGVDGEIVTLINVDSTPNTIALPDSNGLQLAGVITLNQGDTITLIYSSTVGDWLEVARGDNGP